MSVIWRCIISSIAFNNEVDLPELGIDNAVSGSVVRIIEPELYQSHLDAADKDYQRSNLECDRRRVNCLKKYQQLAAYKALMPYPVDIAQRLKKIACKFPNGVELLKKIHNHAELQSIVMDGYASLPNILLVGPPGCGKTALLRDLAKALAPEYHYLHMGFYSESFAISGLSLGYETGKPGIIAEILNKTYYANCWIIADEFEKGGSGIDRSTAYVPMFQLLEKSTAKTFTDIALEMEMDTSHITWLMTANDINEINDALVSRCHVIYMEHPTPEQMPQIIRSVWDGMLEAESWGRQFSRILDGDVINKLGNYSARELQIILRQAAGKAVHRQGKASSYHIACSDLSSFDAEQKKSRPMGFI